MACRNINFVQSLERGKLLAEKNLRSKIMVSKGCVIISRVGGSVNISFGSGSADP
jgi:hypothetical protein